MPDIEVEKYGKLTWQWKIHPLKMYFLLKMGIFHCHVSLPKGKSINKGNMWNDFGV